MTDYDIDQLMESMVKILDSENKTVAGSGFIIRSDGYLITGHHVICHLASLNVEYQGQEYEAEWCEAYSNHEVDIAILKIDVENAKAVPIINPKDLSTPVRVYGFPPSKEKNFPDGFDFSAQHIRRSAPVKTLSTYRSREISFNNPWNILPEDESMFRSCRIDTSVDPGTSGGPVFAEELSGVVGVIQCSKSGESYIIRWDNILEELDVLGLEPEKNAVCQFLESIENDFKYIPFFHTRQKIVLKDQYIPIQVTLERRYRHEVETTWGYAESEAELKRAYALKGMDEESERSKVDWEEARKQHQSIMVLADPGMGKSTLLRIEALSNAQEEREKLLKREKNVKEAVDEVVFPLFLRLSDLSGTEKEIFDDIPILIKRNYPTTWIAIAPILKEKLTEGKCLLLLDALDEVPKEDRIHLAEKLDRFAKNYPCPIISTSRIVGYGGPLVDDTKEVEIVPFSQKQTEHYIETWFTNAADSIIDDTVSAGGLIRELRNKPQILGLTQNPLLLSLLCSLYQEKELTLPSRRSLIYEKAVNCMLGEWRTRHSRQQPEEGWIIAKTELLEELAYQFSCEGKEIFSLRELHDKIRKYLRGERGTNFRDIRDLDLLIKELSEEDGIIQKLSREGDKYLFLHRTFQEYLTASYLNWVLQEDQSAGITLAKAHFWEYDWHETLSLLTGLMDDPTPLLQAIRDEKDDIFSSMLLLAGRCIAECEADSHPLIAEMINSIYRLWHSYPSFGFIEPVVVALGQANSQMSECLQKALKGGDSDIRRGAAMALGKIGSPQVVELLIQALKDEDIYVRGGAAEALGEIGSPQVVELLIQARKDEYSDVREGAAEALGEIGSPQVAELLIQALKDEDIYVRGGAAEALGGIGSPQAVELLIQALKDEDIYVREGAAEALGEIGSPQAVELLIQALKDEDIYVRWAAAMALGKSGSPQAVEPLIQALKDEDDGVRGRAAGTLGEIGSPQAVEPLIQALKDEDDGVRGRAAGALGEIGSPQAVEPLIQALKDEYSDVRRWAAGALGEIGSPQAVEPLIQALKDEDDGVRGRAAGALGEIGSPQAVEPLIQALKDEDDGVRGRAAGALGEIGSPQAVEPLIQALKDEYSDVRRWAAGALGEIGSLEILEKLIQLLEIDIYDTNIFPVARKLAVLYSKERVPFLPVYPEMVSRE